MIAGDGIGSTMLEKRYESLSGLNFVFKRYYVSYAPEYCQGTLGIRRNVLAIHG